MAADALQRRRGKSKDSSYIRKDGVLRSRVHSLGKYVIASKQGRKEQAASEDQEIESDMIQLYQIYD